MNVPLRRLHAKYSRHRHRHRHRHHVLVSARGSGIQTSCPGFPFNAPATLRSLDAVVYRLVSQVCHAVSISSIALFLVVQALPKLPRLVIQATVSENVSGAGTVATGCSSTVPARLLFAVAMSNRAITEPLSATLLWRLVPEQRLLLLRLRRRPVRPRPRLRIRHAVIVAGSGTWVALVG